MTGPVRRLVASALAWIVGAIAAVAVGVLALSMIGDDLTSRTAQPLSADAVAREASAAPTEIAGPAGPTPTPSGSQSSELAAAAAPPPAGAAAPTTAVPAPGQGSGGGGVEKVVSSPGGTAIARCAKGQVYLVSWSPEQGYRSDNVARGPAAVASVKFESDANKVFLSVRCVGSEPQGSVVARADDHGGGDSKKDG